MSIDRLRATGREAGLDVVEVTGAHPFESTRVALEERKAAGLHAGMAFTYRDPLRATDPARTMSEVAALVVGARSYLTTESAPAVTAPAARVARYAWDDHYRALRVGLEAIATLLRAHGWKARVMVDDNGLVDRAAAHRAGIGWWGKNANLLLPGLGSWYVLGAVLTTAPLVAPGAAAPLDDGCGGCTRCIDGCPTAAITAPGVVDARRCLSWLLQAEGVFPIEHRVALGDRIYGCDDCQEVCPPNRRASVAPATPTARAWVPLLALLDDDDGAVLAWADRWYIPKREVRYVRRNALVVLGNVGEPTDPAVTDVIVRHLGHHDPLLRAHAVWAARRLGREDLLAAVRTDDDPLVVAELSADVPSR